MSEEEESKRNLAVDDAYPSTFSASFPSTSGHQSTSEKKLYSFEEMYCTFKESSGEEYSASSNDDFESTEDVSDEEESDTTYFVPAPSIPVSSTIVVTPGDTVTLPSVVWLKDKPSVQPIDFKGSPGLKVKPIGSEPIDYFSLLADKEFFDLVIKGTNYEGKKLFSQSAFPKSRKKIWKDIDESEFSVFLGLLFLSGNIKVHNIPYYWKKNKLYCFPTFSSAMSRDRFLLILRALHFRRNPDSGELCLQDPLFKIRPLIDLFHDNMSRVYYPSKELCLDESMILWRGRLYFRHYSANKRYKYGIKMYMLTQPDGLVCRTLVHCGSHDPDVGGPGHTEKVVYKLITNYLQNGHSIYMDKLYSSVSLTRHLLRQNTYVTGILHESRIDNPVEIVNKKLAKGEVEQSFTQEGICVMKWRNKREVIMVSSEFDGKIIEDKMPSGKVSKKPDVVLQYNNIMGVIDRNDELSSYYPCQRKQSRWYVKLGIHYFHIILNNSFILYKLGTGSTMRLIDYRDKVIECLLLSGRDESTSFVSERVGEDKVHLPKKVGDRKRKRCRQCYQKGIRRDVQYFCNSCPENPGFCLDPCFQEFHKY